MSRIYFAVDVGLHQQWKNIVLCHCSVFNKDSKKDQIFAKNHVFFRLPPKKYTNHSYLAVSKLAVFSNSRFSFCYFPPNSRSQTLKFAVFENFYSVWFPILRKNYTCYCSEQLWATVSFYASVYMVKTRIWMIRTS